MDELAAEFRAHQLQKKHEEDPQVAPAAQALPGGEITAATPEVGGVGGSDTWVCVVAFIVFKHIKS